MLEIDVDIGRFFAFLGDEAVEEELVLSGVHAGDLKAIAHGRIGSRAPALTQDWRVNGAREIDDILDGEEVSRKVELCDQRKLALERVVDGFGHAFWISPLCPRPCLTSRYSLRVIPSG